MNKSRFEKDLAEIDTYEITDAAKALWKELYTKLDSLLTSVSICCNEDMDSVMIWKNDNKKFYFDIELNDDKEHGEDGTKFSLFTKDFITNKDGWIEEFSVDEVTPEWVMQNIRHFSRRQV